MMTKKVGGKVVILFRSLSRSIALWFSLPYRVWAGVVAAAAAAGMYNECLEYAKNDKNSTNISSDTIGSNLLFVNAFLI